MFPHVCNTRYLGQPKCTTQRASRSVEPFWATVCKTVRPILSDSCLPCSVLSVLSVTLMYCGQTAGWIKMKLGMGIGLGPGHNVLDRDPAALSKTDTHTQFSAHVCCGQMAGRIKMPRGTEVGLGPGDIVLDGNPAPPLKKGHSSPLSPCLLHPNSRTS